MLLTWLKKEKMDRREFIRKCARYAAVLSLAAVSGALIERSRRTTSAGPEQCVNNGVCRGCGAFADCALPLALSVKNAGVRRSTTNPGMKNGN